MKDFRVGVMSDSFRLGVREGISKASAIGADGVQVYAVSGEMSPEAMDAAARDGLRRFCADEDLEISALCGDLGGHGFQLAGENIEKVKKSKAIVDLASDLGAPVVTTHIGVVPEDSSCEMYTTMRTACKELGDYAYEKGVSFAIETGPEPAVRLKAFLDDVSSKGMGVNFDPANLVMVCADDPVKGVHTLKDYIVHTHAKDGVQLQPCNPVMVYGAFAEGGFGKLVEETGELFREVALGDGQVDWPAYLGALEAIGYDGFLTIEREVGDAPAADIAQAVQFLRECIRKN